MPEDRTPTFPTPQAGARRAAALLCGLQALVLVGWCGFYVYEIADGQADDVMRAVMSVVLMAVFAVGLGLLARGWLRGVHWATTPTIVWNILLLPVATTLAQGGDPLVGGLVAILALAGVVAAATSRAREEGDAETR